MQVFSCDFSMLQVNKYYLQDVNLYVWVFLERDEGSPCYYSLSD